MEGMVHHLPVRRSWLASWPAAFQSSEKWAATWIQVLTAMRLTSQTQKRLCDLLFALQDPRHLYPQLRG